MHGPRVLQVFDSLGMGGAEVWLLELLRHWAGLPDAPRCDIVCTSGDTAIFDDEAKRLGANIFYVPFGRRHLPAFRRSLIKILRTGSYAAIHDHQDYAAGWHFWAANRVLPTRRIVHVHNPFFQLQLTRGKDFVGRIQLALSRRFVAKYATDVLGTSTDVLTEYGFRTPAFRNKNVQTLHCGFDVERFGGSRDEARQKLLSEFKVDNATRIVLFAGRIDHSVDSNHATTHKNAPLAVKIAIATLKTRDQLLFLFAGKRSDASPIIEQWVKDANCEESIRFLGIRNDIGTLMSGADLLLFPSRSEGLGMVAVEAQAAGLPVLASTGVPRECQVVPDMVRFVACEAPLDEWTKSLCDMLDTPRTAAATCQHLVKASAYSIPNSAAALEEIYSNCPRVPR